MSNSYAEVVAVLQRKRNVAINKARTGFGSGALTVKGHIFAMLSSRGEFVVKLPRERVDELVARRLGTPFDAGRGRPMKEWLVVGPRSGLSSAEIAEEARSFASRAR
jgi:hypothetical protein